MCLPASMAASSALMDFAGPRTGNHHVREHDTSRNGRSGSEVMAVALTGYRNPWSAFLRESVANMGPTGGESTAPHARSIKHGRDGLTLNRSVCRRPSERTGTFALRAIRRASGRRGRSRVEPARQRHGAADVSRRDRRDFGASAKTRSGLPSCDRRLVDNAAREVRQRRQVVHHVSSVCSRIERRPRARSCGRAPSWRWPAAQAPDLDSTPSIRNISVLLDQGVLRLDEDSGSARLASCPASRRRKAPTNSG